MNYENIKRFYQVKESMQWWWIAFVLVSFSMIKFNFINALILVFFACFIGCVKKINFKELTIAIFFSLLIVIMQLFYNSKVVIFSNLFDNLMQFSLRDYLINHIENIHNEQNKSLILLILFNEKNVFNTQLYNDLKKLSVVHLIVVSGLHLTTITNQIGKLFYKYQFIGNTINFLLVIFSCYLLNFSYSSFRALILIFISSWKKIKNLNFLDKTAICAVVTILFSPNAISSMSFKMTYVACVGIYLASFFEIKNVIISNFATSFIICLVLLPYITLYNKYLSIWQVIISVFYGWIFLASFCCMIFFAWTACFAWIISFFSNLINFLVKSFLTINLTLKINFFDQNYFLAYYLIVPYAIKQSIIKLQNW